MEQLSRSSDEKESVVAADVMGQSRIEQKVEQGRCVELLLALLSRTHSIQVLTSALFALGHLRDPRSEEPLIGFAQHPDPRVRYAAVSSLCGLSNPRCVEALIVCSRDPDRDVRNWATFGLGSQIDLDTPALREALVARLAEEDDEIRGEALVGLASRGDVRAGPALLRELSTHSPEVLQSWTLISDAAEEVIRHAKSSGSEEWWPVMEKLKQLGLGGRVEA